MFSGAQLGHFHPSLSLSGASPRSSALRPRCHARWPLLSDAPCDSDGGGLSPVPQSWIGPDRRGTGRADHPDFSSCGSILGSVGETEWRMGTGSRSAERRIRTSPRCGTSARSSTSSNRSVSPPPSWMCAGESHQLQLRDDLDTFKLSVDTCRAALHARDACAEASSGIAPRGWPRAEREPSQLDRNPPFGVTSTALECPPNQGSTVGARAI